MDFSMCNNHRCEKRTKCARYMSKPDSMLQAYQHFSPDVNRDGKFSCKFYINKDDNHSSKKF